MSTNYLREITFTIPNATGRASTQVNIIEKDGNLVFTVEAFGGAGGLDLRGLFFQIDESVLPGLRIINADPTVTKTQIGKNNVLDLGDGTNMNGAVKSGFDIGVGFGTPGVGKDGGVTGPVSFTLDGAGALTLDALTHMQFGAVVTGASGPSKSLFTVADIRGAHTQYDIANNNGSLYIHDLVPGRDGTRNLPANTRVNFTDGTGVFDATGKTEDVARLYRAAFGRTPDQTGLENVTAPINSGTLGLNDAAMYFVASPEFTARYGTLSNGAFVGQLYQNVLGRTGSAQEVNAWADQINHGMSRGAVLVGFSDSFENKVGALSYCGDKDYGEAYRLYQTAFNRTPDTPGLRGWVTNLDNGMSLDEVAQGFVVSAEFANAYADLSASDFVSQLYQNVLHRAGEASGVSGWVGQLNAGASQASVLLGFSDSLENRVNTAASTHDGWVFLTT